MFGNPGLNEFGFPEFKIGQLANSINYGTSKPATENGSIPYLRMGNMTDDGHLVFDDLKYIHLPESEFAKVAVTDGDFLFNRTNSRQHVGRSAVYHGKSPSVIAGYIIRVRLKQDLVLPDYLSLYMNTPFMKKTLFNMAKGAVNQANINAQEMSSISIPLLPLVQQKQYLDFLGSIDKLKFNLQQAIDRAKKLSAKILNDALSAEE